MPLSFRSSSSFELAIPTKANIAINRNVVIIAASAPSNLVDMLFVSNKIALCMFTVDGDNIETNPVFPIMSVNG